MSLFIASLNSGSNGNCYYIGNAHDAVFVDAGISCRETEKRMKRAGLSMQKVRAIFISHEHGDHIRGVEVLSRKYQLPVYITAPTLQNSGLRLDTSLVREFKAYEPVSIGELSVTAFPKWHDASDPHSFRIDGHGVTTGVFTDIGAPCEHVVQNFGQCHAAFLESNYDEEMLEHGRYPHYLKKRISGDEGHLSNNQALELFTTHRPEFMSHLLLAHLSRDNNRPELVHELFSRNAGNTHVAVASRYEETAVYRVQAGPAADPQALPVAAVATVQLSLF